MNVLYFATHKMERPRGWSGTIPVGRYWRCALVVLFNYGVDTGTMWKSAPRIPEKVWVLGTFSQQDRVCVLAASHATIFPSFIFRGIGSRYVFATVESRRAAWDGDALPHRGRALGLPQEEFDAFWRSIVAPMIRRHQEMFPQMHRRVATDPSQSGPSPRAHPRMAAPAEPYPGTDRYAPCPCNSGQKYKFCCGARGR